MADSLNPWPVGDTLPITMILQTDSGTGVDLTGLSAANLILLIRNISSGPPTEVQGVGAFIVSQYSPPAIVVYYPQAADVGTIGSFELRVQITAVAYIRTVGPFTWQVVAK